METWNYKFLNIPHPPQKFIDLALTENIDLYGPLNTLNHYRPTRRIMKNCLSTGEHVTATRYSVPDEFRQWIIENISPDVAETSISISSFATDGLLAPHTDRSRRYAVMYVVKQGGPDVRTCFWQEKGYPQLRDEFATVANDISLPGDYKDLELLESADFGTNQWLILNSKVFHSVEHINGTRISFQFSVGPDISALEKFFK